jgi:hypothetical protein
LYFLTSRLGDKDVSDIRKAIPRKDLVEAWKDLEDHAKDLAKRLAGKEAATPSRTWQLLSSARPEMILFLAITARQQAVVQKIKNFFTKWRLVQQKVPLLEMAELHITPQLPAYPKIANDVFLLLLDGKLRSRTEILKFLKPLAPPPPPPPPPPPAKRGRGAKAAAAAVAAAAVAAAASVKGGAKTKGKGAPAVVAPATAPVATGKSKGKVAAPPVVAPAAAAPVAAKPGVLAKPAAAVKGGKQSKAPVAKPSSKPAKPVKPTAKIHGKAKASKK